MGWNQLPKFGPNQFQSCQIIVTTFLFATSITPWQMQPTCTNATKQYHLDVCIAIRIKLLVTWLKHRWEKSVTIIVMILYYWTLNRITESIKSIHIYIDILGFDISGQRPCLIVISNRTNWINLLEPTAAYETNIDLNSERKEKNYRALMDSLG